MGRLPTNAAGITAFQSSMTIKPRKAAASTIKSGLPQYLAPYLICTSPSKIQFVVYRLQAPAQIQDRVALSGQQGVDSRATLQRHILEAAALELMRNKDLALIGRQFVKRLLQLLQDYRSRVHRLRTRIERRQREIELVLARPLLRLFDHFNCRRISLFAKSVDDAIACDTEQPSADLLDRLGKAISLDKLLQHVLQYVLGVARVPNPASDERPKPRALAHDGGGDLAISLNHERGGGGSI